jgi:protocatechuate 3,4-dioxygenase beta subunit
MGEAFQPRRAFATVNGVVSDPSGAAIPDARVSLTNVNTAVLRTTVANSSGAYAFLNVVPGVYTLEASAAGFARVTQAAVTLARSQPDRHV